MQATEVTPPPPARSGSRCPYDGKGYDRPGTATIVPMVKPYRPGVEARRAILKELRRRELAGEPAPSAVLVASVLGMPRTTVSRHVENLRRLGWASTTTGRSAVITLTDAGRNAADML